MCILKGQTTFDTGNITVNSRPVLLHADPLITQYDEHHESCNFRELKAAFLKL